MVNKITGYSFVTYQAQHELFIISLIYTNTIGQLPVILYIQ